MVFEHTIWCLSGENPTSGGIYGLSTVTSCRIKAVIGGLNQRNRLCDKGLLVYPYYGTAVDKKWNSGDNSQAEDRAHRIGTAGTVNVISLVAKGTVDEGIEEYLIENRDLFERVVDGKGSKADVRQILNKLLKL